nr:phage head closure protein [uncultured Cohaesibacter sp.]
MAQTGLVSFQFDPAGLRHQVSLLKPVFDDEMPWNGAETLDTVAEVWAGILSVESNGRTEAEQEANSLTLRFVIRFRDDLKDVTAIEYKGDLYDCLKLQDPDASERWLILEARTRLGAQT